MLLSHLPVKVMHKSRTPACGEAEPACSVARHLMYTGLSVTMERRLKAFAHEAEHPLGSWWKGAGGEAGHAHGRRVLLPKYACPTASEVGACAGAGRVCFWELVDGALVAQLAAHAGVVCSLAMHPAGECLLTSSVDGAIKVWQ